MLGAPWATRSEHLHWLRALQNRVAAVLRNLNSLVAGVEASTCNACAFACCGRRDSDARPTPNQSAIQQPSCAKAGNRGPNTRLKRNNRSIAHLRNCSHWSAGSSIVPGV